MVLISFLLALRGKQQGIRFANLTLKATSAYVFLAACQIDLVSMLLPDVYNYPTVNNTSALLYNPDTLTNAARFITLVTRLSRSVSTAVILSGTLRLVLMFPMCQLNPGTSGRLVASALISTQALSGGHMLTVTATSKIKDNFL